MGRKLKRRRFCSAAFATLCVAGLVACGSSGSDYSSKPPDYEKALAGAPPPLAALHAKANQLIPGGTDAFHTQLAKLRGYPVVVNKWASWCGPCREEFPWFQKASAKYGTQVAFLGVDSDDSDDAAKTFLGEFPVPYPSFSDSDQAIADDMKATLGFPTTAFYDRSGKLAYVRPGRFRDAAELQADIMRYALGD
jgi:cytochrome c biogenesis protein CcmG/thiol:disulfide interchange protein DsbE